MSAAVEAQFKTESLTDRGVGIAHSLLIEACTGTENTPIPHPCPQKIVSIPFYSCLYSSDGIWTADVTKKLYQFINRSVNRLQSVSVRSGKTSFNNLKTIFVAAGAP